MDLHEAYSMMSPSDPTRGQSARLVHEETERLRVSAPVAQPLPLPPAVVPMGQQKRAPAPPPDKYREARKIALYALIVALGLAFHHVAADWLTRYLEKAYLSENSEQVAKLCYPASVAALIWVLRTWK
jgi:hypothetical protein